MALCRPSFDLLLLEAKGISQSFIKELSCSDSQFPAFTACLYVQPFGAGHSFRSYPKALPFKIDPALDRWPGGGANKTRGLIVHISAGGKKNYEWNVRTDCCSTSPDYSQSWNHRLTRKKLRSRERERRKNGADLRIRSQKYFSTGDGIGEGVSGRGDLTPCTASPDC